MEDQNVNSQEKDGNRKDKEGVKKGNINEKTPYVTMDMKGKKEGKEEPCG